MNTNAISANDTLPDPDLLQRVTNGDRQAFGTLVARYQNLVCSVAYSVVGDFKRSEDIAQDAFVSAWKSLTSLRDPSQFKAWLCGIARNLALRSVRREGRANLETVDDSMSDPSSSPDVVLMDREEEALIWENLSALPENYREPLVLFYREDQSVARVAEALGLSEANVRQRLSRGREMLRDSVVSMIDRALRTSRPSPAFTMTVVGALPGLFLASAGTAAAATSSGVAKAGTAGALGKAAASASWIGGLLGILGGTLGAWAGTWASMQTARSDRQRDFLKNSFRPFVVASVIFVIPSVGLRLARASGFQIPGEPMAAGLVIWSLAFAIYLIRKSLRVQRRAREILIEDEAMGLTREPDTSLQRFANQWEGREWKSRATLLGIPLIHIHFSDPARAPTPRATSMWGTIRQAPVARGWIALGERASGILLGIGGFATGLVAMGGIAVGGIAMGGMSLGVVSLGGLAVGALVLGGMSLGGWAWGGMAIGWMAFGGMALAWKAAYGGMAIAHDIAFGGHALAEQANNAAAKAYMAKEPFFVWSEAATQKMLSPWAFFVVLAISLVPTLIILVVGYRKKNPQNHLECNPHHGHDTPFRDH